jgi:taurine dioxygenase
LQITPMAEHVGAEITGIQLSALGPDGVQSLKNALATHGVLHFRDQELTPEQHIAFARAWGGIDLNQYFPINGGYPEIAEVRKSEEQKANIGGGWHTDHSYDEIPAMGSILVARELPPVGGDTLFASMAAAWDALSPGFQAMLRTLKGVHSADHIYSADGYYSQTDLAGELRGKELKTHAVHPAVIQHPVTGRPLLYVNGAFLTHFEGWTHQESRAIINYLYEFATQEQFTCRIQWKPGSVAMWDNRSTWHTANNDYHGHRRLMHRITLTGEALRAAA